MKKFIMEFLQRGSVSCGLGPIVLAVIYMILKANGVVESLTVNEAAIGIFSLAALAFIAGGLTSIYKIERLPLMLGILIHGAVLYVSYLITYLVNGWLEQGATPVLVFSGILVVGYIAIWAVIYPITKRNTKKVNEMLIKKQNSEFSN
jgi:peptidoglycan/LPS O-acetylase OafA/YrhL